MKRMSEVFELPVTKKSLRVPVSSVLDDVDVRDVEALVAHAINNVDALADALGNLINQVESSYTDMIDMKEAIAALNTYRGTK